MSPAAASLLRLTARVEAAAGALVRARFDDFAEAASTLEAADLGCLSAPGGLGDDDEAVAACRALQRALDRLGGLLGHVAGVQQALRALDPVHATVYDRRGTGAAGWGGSVREEA